MCAIAGVYSPKKEPIIVPLRRLLLALGNRGEGGTGVATMDDQFMYRSKKDQPVEIALRKDKDLKRVKFGHAGIGHLRYATRGNGGIKRDAVHPFYLNYPLGFYFGHNGQIHNVDELMDEHTMRLRNLRSDSDSEVFANFFAVQFERALSEISSLDDANKRQAVMTAAKEVMRRVKGAYCVTVLIKGVGVLAFRDQFGIHPLVMGYKVDETVAFASEDAALKYAGFKHDHDTVKPGEAVLVCEGGNVLREQVLEPNLHISLFELLYFARPDSTIEGISNSQFRRNMGSDNGLRIKELGWPITSVTPIPDSGRFGAYGLSESLSVPIREGIVRNKHFAGRVFINESTDRKVLAQDKFAGNRAEIEGHHTILADDTVVRSDTIVTNIDIVREVGASGVYVAPNGPKVLYQDIYGIDIAYRSQLIAPRHHSDQDISREIGADGIFYPSPEDAERVAKAMNPNAKLEMGCFTGKYVTNPPESYLQALENGH